MAEASRFRGEIGSVLIRQAGTNLTVYDGEDEEHFISVFAITSVSIVGQKASE